MNSTCRHPSPPTRTASPLFAGAAALGLLLLTGCPVQDIGSEDDGIVLLGEEGDDQGDDDSEGDDDDGEPADDDDSDPIGDDDDSDPVDDDDDDDSDPVGDDDDEPFEPTEGDWVVITSDLTEDGCGLEDLVDRGQPGSIMGLDVTGESSFDLTFAAGGETVSCTLYPELDYDCATTSTTDTTPSDYGLDALILVDITSDGQFTASDAQELSTTVDLDCSGPDCGWVTILLGASFPCTMTMDSDFVVDEGA